MPRAAAVGRMASPLAQADHQPEVHAGITLPLVLEVDASVVHAAANAESGRDPQVQPAAGLQAEPRLAHVVHRALHGADQELAPRREPARAGREAGAGEERHLASVDPPPDATELEGFMVVVAADLADDAEPARHGHADRPQPAMQGLVGIVDGGIAAAD